MAHVVFYDGECGLCHRAVRFIAARDRQRKFLFAPLQGVTADQVLSKPVDPETMLLLENYRTPHPRELKRGKAVLRICWHLGRGWRLLGLFSFLPVFLANLIYRLVARNRHLFTTKKPPMDDPGRLLP